MLLDSIMQRRWLIGVALLAGWPAEAWAAPNRYVLEPDSAHVRFRGRSTLHGFAGETDVVRGEMTFDPQQRQLTAPAHLAIPVESLRTGIGARDRAMYAMFEADRFPELTITIESVSVLDEPRPIDATPRRYLLHGRLRIRQIERPIEFQAQATVTEDAVEVSGTLPLTTAMFDLKPPSVIGLIRVRNTLVVEFTAHWTRRL